MRKVLIIGAVVIAAAGAADAGDVSFSLDINNIPTTIRGDPATEARLAQWNDPMGRLLYHFNQQQAWIMRGTMPGGERASGAAIMVKAQHGLPLRLLATTMQSGLIAAQQDLAQVRWPWIDDEALAAIPLDEQLAIELGRRLVPQ
ncbi:MAG: hypothetical protein QNL88_12095 [Acidobacteriota bacterium]|nr:hypothetical protein [Acidobacteriota bacterium]